ncbi:MAG: hypothetical protein MMC33_001296 [Icmadophila ericetorum]|nr:hypothetical protein [Icmadophila ericetorum]
MVQAMSLLGSVVQANPKDGEVSFAVYNPCGFARPVGALVTIPHQYLNRLKAYKFRLQSQGTGNAQRLQNGDFVFPYCGIGSMGFATAYLLPEDATPQAPYTFGNDKLQVTIQQDKAWALSSILDKTTSTELLTNGHLGNQIKVFYEQYSSGSGCKGNLFQMGNELYPTSTQDDGFYTNSDGMFSGTTGELMESGPYLWHFKGAMYNDSNKLTLTVEYMLEYGDPVIRVRVTGAAGTNPTSIVTTWELTDGKGGQPAIMNYGTPNHWHSWQLTDTNNTSVPYWQGPTFRSTHDYLTLTDGQGIPLAGVYHEGMRAWALEKALLYGILFRNPPGKNRGACGTDTAQHMQNFAFRLPSIGHPLTCQPLKESLAIQQSQYVVPICTTSPAASLPAAYPGLASVEEPDAIIRVARLQGGSGKTDTNVDPVDGPCPFSFVLRLYQPTNDRSRTWHVSVPFLETNSKLEPPVDTDNNPPHQASDNQKVLAPPQVQLVTALEELLSDTAQTQPTYSDGVVTVTDMPTLATLWIQGVGTTVAPI